MSHTPSLTRPVRRLLGLIGTAVVITAVSAMPPVAATPTDHESPVTRHSSTGCGREPGQQPGSSSLQPLRSGGLDRSYQLHVPDDYSPDRSYPLIMVFHGRGKTGAQTEQFTGFDRQPAILVYPNGVIGEEDKQAWQGAPYARQGVDDVAFTADLMDQVESDYCIDLDRVFAAGKSNGAGFTAILACRMADRIAAVAPVAGAFYITGEPCRPSRPIAVLEVHGTGDTVVPYDGDGTKDEPAIRTWVHDWAVRDGCRLSPRRQTIGDDVSSFSYRGCSVPDKPVGSQHHPIDTSADVLHLAVTDGGHTWPGSDSSSGPGYVTQTFSATEVSWQFFADHPLPNRR
ncbi:alpha/beta hydrolase family esterase [Microlunatus soli]|uniref:Polyhydroxybutyrate depolymerase n=1 Tax=Microlunatus soli TaxID=630515 RepID=A0A1H1V7N5_9ACTN|nr:PHB depolymerase family esterase [Microlunatus soli]SDS80491.1 polyhydroxybutyrate depolymerase [Microlunatus soli]